MSEILSAPLTVKHVLPGGGVVYHSGPKVSIMAPEDAPAYVTVEVGPLDVRECHGGTVFVINATGATIETLVLS